MATEYLPVALAGVALSSIVVFAIGATLLSATHVGVWAGVTVFGFLFAAVAVTVLYAFGEMERADDPDRQERF